MAGLSAHESGGGGYLVLTRWVARATATWAHASARRWGETWVGVSRFPDFWPFGGGQAYSLQGSGMCQGSWKGVEFGGSLAPFFSPPPLNKQTNKKKSYVPLGHQPDSALWLQLCDIWASWGLCGRWHYHRLEWRAQIISWLVRIRS